jgi:biotin-(acetyl-CoA carboxylase) ligase
MLTKEDLNAIGELIDTKLEIKLEEKLEQKLEKKLNEKLDTVLDKKLKPIHRKLNKLQRDLTSTIRFFDNEHTNLATRVRKIEDHLQMY